MARPDTPRTSVIVPARDSEATVAETLASLVAQTDDDWEAVIVDDGSRDGTPRILAGYAAREPRLRVVTADGEGVSAARNLGLAQARGRRILFLDSDDWIERDFLLRMNAALDESPGAVAAYCGYRRVTPGGALSPARLDDGPAEAPFETFARRCAVAVHAVLAERESLVRVGGFDTSLKTCEDWDLWQRLARTGGRWKKVDAALSYYRTSASSLTQDTAQMLADAKLVIARGFGEDPRVSDAAPDHRAGARVSEQGGPALAFANLALWCAAFEVGRGGGGAPPRDVLADLPPAPEFAHDSIQILFDGLMVGRRTAAERLAEDWPDYGASLTALVEALGAAWSDPVAARRVQYGLERTILDYDDLARPRRLALTLGVRVDLKRPRTIVPPPGVDRLYVYLCSGEEVLDLLDLGVLGPVTAAQWIDLSIARYGGRETVRYGGPAAVRRVALRKADRRIVRVARRLGRPGRSLLSAVEARLDTASHTARLKRLAAAAEAAAEAEPPPVGEPSAPSRARGAEGARVGDRRAFWERLFAEEDPWNYGSPYEQEKYRRQLALLPAGRLGLGLELACAEGRFTRTIAPRFERLIATDISQTALDRARAQCGGSPNVEFRRLDLVADELPGPLDALFCSEVLYYLSGVDELACVAGKLAAALKPGGVLVAAHAYVLKDDPSRTGFDWQNPFGARRIHEVLAATPGLALDAAIETELYRIDRFVRIAEGHPVPEPRVETLPIEAPIEAEVARHLVRGGALARRAELAAEERHARIPVLMYHAVAEEGPESLARYRVAPEMFREQMLWLRRNGYHAIGTEELLWFLERRHPFVGRPVLITFDDGLQSFADEAWPILRSHDLKAEVFVVTDLAGTSAQWDAAYGPPAALMAPETVRALGGEGALFGSHLATHRAADGLATRALAEELARSRAALGRWLGRPPLSLAAPFGLSDARLRQLARECGYKILFGARDGVASLEDDPLDLPRIEVRGDRPLGDFVQALEAAR
ncbi:MAG: glycosyltransferase [Alphaproteobacteria bacterium]|nr:glycosyltransferase [Alphaproteobacteria bacterium]